MSLLPAGLAVIVSVAGNPAPGPVANVPDWSIESTLGVSASTAQPRSGSSVASLWVHRRWTLGATGWCTGAGASAERYTFSTAREGEPRRLESVAAPLSLEFFQDGEAVAGAVVRPGRYFADGAYRSSWDAPVEVAAGFPLSGGWNGLVGGSAGRFYRRPFPVFGVAGELSRNLRLEAFYPEPALIWKRAHVLVRLGGELVGGGFHRDSSTAGGDSVEYYAYRVGVALSFERGRTRITWSGGIEPLRRFEFAAGRRAVRERSGAFLACEVQLRP